MRILSTILLGAVIATAGTTIDAMGAKKVVKQPAGPSVEELMEQGRAAFFNYDFSKAGNDFAAARKKAGKNIPDGLVIYEDELANAQNFLDRVEKIVILDSIAVPRDEFFKNYRLPGSAGYLSNSSALPFENNDADYVFTNEGGDYKLWAQPDTTGNLVLMESSLLTDSSWQEPAPLSDALGAESNQAYPFMMPDGVTLYYASDNENSLGGYDIFVATRDNSDGSFLQPQNIGMPYNSPFDDYLLAIDEYNGIGWWATDRNQLGDKITIYVFKTNEIRKNYDASETENLPSLAFISDYKSTWGEEDYSSYLDIIDNITSEPEKRQIDFIFPLSGGRVYYTLDDFHSSAARSMMVKYLAASKALDKKLARLSDLRHKYASSKSPSLKSQIRSLEKDTEADSLNVNRLRSEVYRAESNH